MEDNIDRFIVRLNSILIHELSRDYENIFKYANHLNKVGPAASLGESPAFQTSVNASEFPNEEYVESLAVRIRPIFLNDEDVYYGKVFSKISSVINSLPCSEEIDRARAELEYLRLKFQILDGNNSAEERRVLIGKLMGNEFSGNDSFSEMLQWTQATADGVSIQLRDGMGNILRSSEERERPGESDLVRVAYSWIYQDIVHSVYKHNELSVGHNIDQRFGVCYPIVFLWLLLVREVYLYLQSNPRIISEITNRDVFSEDVDPLSEFKPNIYSEEILDKYWSVA